MAATIQHIELPKKPRAKDTSSSKQVVSQNLLADSGFTGITQAESTPGTPWTTGVGWTIGSGVASCDGSQSGVSYLYNHDTDLTDPENKFWEITYSITARSAGTVKAMVGGYGPETAAQSVVDTYTEIVGPINSSSVPRFYIGASADFVGSVDNVSVKSVESFSNNNHGQIYSGRALEFDGVTDYFQSNGGTALAGVNYFADGVPWTFACWIYFDSSSTGTHHYFIGNDFTTHPMLIFQNQNNINKLIFRAEDAGKDYYLFPYGHGPSLNRMDQDAWHRLVVTTDGVSLTAYVNGVHGGDITDGQDDTNADVTFSNTGMDFSGWGTPYQSGGVRQYGLKGMMSDGQVWDATWSADDAVYDYANPESLALNASGTALTEGNLKLWYPMQDGHRGQQSYILDGANTGAGDEMVTNGDFSDGSTDWTTNNTSAGTHEVTFDSKGARFLAGATETVMTLASSAVVETGKNYRLEVVVSNYNGSNGVKIDSGLLSNTLTFSGNGTHVYQVSTTGSGQLISFYRNGSNVDLVIESVSLKAINDKHHATTVFYGDEQISVENNRTFAGAGNWTNGGGSNAFPVFNVNSSYAGALAAVSADDASNVKYAFLDGAHWEDADGDGPAMVEGRTYRLSFDANLTRSSGILSIGLANASHSLSSDIMEFEDTADSLTTYNVDFVYNATNHAEIIIHAATNSSWIVQLDNVSVKEVGVASGWTDADQQLDIAQPALQSYNELAWFDGEADYVTIADHDDLSFDPMSISAWVNMNDATDFPIIGKGAYNSTAEYQLKVQSDDKIHFWVADESVSSCHIGRATPTITTQENKWIHVVGTYSGGAASSGLKIYINGVQSDDANDEAAATSFVAMENLGADVYIGKYSNTYANGCVTETSLWDKELSSTEVLELFNDGKALDALTHSATANIKGYWRNKGLSTWTDLKGSNNGTPTNITETILIPQGVDGSRDAQGFLMNKARNTSSLNYSTKGSDYTAVLDKSDIQLAGTAASWVCWVKLDSLSDGDMKILSKAPTTAGSSSAYQIRTNNDDLLFQIHSGGWRTDTRSDFFTNTDWVHIAVTIDGSNNVNFYKNGDVFGSEADIGYAVPANVGPLHIGTRIQSAGAYAEFLKGKVDGVLLYNKELSQPEIERNYKATKGSHRN